MRSITGTLGAAVLGLVILVSSAAAAHGTTTKKAITLSLVEKERGFNFIDNPPKGGPNDYPLIGDAFVLTSDVQTKSGAHAGTLEATCMVTRGGKRPRGVCYGMFALAGGQIAAMGMLNEGQSSMIAVLGGTGVYAGASGTITTVSRGDNSPYTDDTLHLVFH